jgi:hypothetical protein
VNGTDVDDFSRALGLHQISDHRLRNEKQALQIYVQDEVVIGFSHVPKIGALFDAGVVNQNVQRTELRNCFRDEALAVGKLRYIGLNSDDSAATDAESLNDALGGLLVRAVADRHGCAFLDEPLRDSKPMPWFPPVMAATLPSKRFDTGHASIFTRTFPKGNAQR